MKAIPTEYNGTLFRSKLEAKWAYFMDLIGCRYEYEPEGYDLGDGVYYCPDFYLPDVGRFLEIKPSYDATYSPTLKFREVTGKSIVTMFGPPFRPDFNCSSCSENGDCDGDFPYWFCICPKCRKVGIEWSGRASYMDCGCDHQYKIYNFDDEAILSALNSVKNKFRWIPKP